MSSTSPGRSSTHAGRRIRSIDLFAVASLSAVLAAGGTYGLVSVGDDGPVVSAPGQSIDSAKDAPSNATPASITGDLNWTGVADQVAPSVVSIQVLTANGGGEGSGVVWDDAGHIVTNAHVVDGGQEVRVTLNDGRSYPAEITGSDPSTDLAVLQLSDIPEGLTPIDIGDDQALSVGSPVMAIGNPLGLSGTVTTGIVSAMDRPVSTAPTSNDPNSGAVTNAIQTSAAINPGNSGGALVDGSGRLIGINSAIASLPSASGETSGNIGIGFAIPMATANGIIDQLIDGGVAEHAFLGVSLTSGEGITGGAVLTGAEVTSVEPGSPAAGGDLQAGDVIVSIDGERVGSSTALVAQVRERASGSEAQIGYLRNGESAEVVVTLDTRPDTGG
ncbi:MAG: trypsin-like peptidase domain-containing protein [Ornithinimicrobium sp.]